MCDNECGTLRTVAGGVSAMPTPREGTAAWDPGTGGKRALLEGCTYRRPDQISPGCRR